jgi:hypothetical protein
MMVRVALLIAMPLHKKRGFSAGKISMERDGMSSTTQPV